MTDRGKHSILGVQIDAVDFDASVERIIEAAKAMRPMAISALAVHGLMTGVRMRPTAIGSTNSIWSYRTDSQYGGRLIGFITIHVLSRGACQTARQARRRRGH